MRLQEFLGQGSFGFVTMVRKKEGAMEGALFALKSLSKLGVVEGGQVQHIKDEKSVSHRAAFCLMDICQRIQSSLNSRCYSQKLLD